MQKRILASRAVRPKIVWAIWLLPKCIVSSQRCANYAGIDYGILRYALNGWSTGQQTFVLESKLFFDVFSTSRSVDPLRILDGTSELLRAGSSRRSEVRTQELERPSDSLVRTLRSPTSQSIRTLR